MVFLCKNEGFSLHNNDLLGSNLVRLANNLPSLFRLLDILKETEIFRGDHPFLYKDVKVDEALPELLSKKEDGNGLYLMRLHESEGFKKLIHGTESPGKSDQSGCSHQKVHLADGKIVELEAQVRGNKRVRRLLKGKDDIESNALGVCIMGASVGGLHNPGTASGGNNMGECLITLTGLGDKARKLACLLVVFAVVQGSPGHVQPIHQNGIKRIFLDLGLNGVKGRFGPLWVRYAGAPKNHDGGFDMLFLLDELRL